MMRKISKHRGVAAIEFALGFIFFWYMCIAWVEMSFISYISGIGDLAIAEAAHVAKVSKSSDDFAALFRAELEKSHSLWRYVANSDNFSISVTYLDGFQSLVDYDPADCDSSDSDEVCGDAKSNIAVYHLTYDYSPIFNMFLNSNALFAREFIAVQEYKRETSL